MNYWMNAMEVEELLTAVEETTAVEPVLWMDEKRGVVNIYEESEELNGEGATLRGCYLRKNRLDDHGDERL
jgi:hypothetical protein